MSMNECHLCGSAEHRILFLAQDHLTGEDFQLVGCDHCGLICVNPMPSLVDLGRYYPVTHQVSGPAAYERLDAKPRIRQIAGLLGGRAGRVLDVGCGKGLLLGGLRDRGWQVHGVELSEVSGRYARSMGLDVCAKPLAACAYEPGGFDVVTMFHSLEHMTEPVQTLRTVSELLRPGGYLVVEVPNAGSWYARLFQGNWFHCDVPRHLFHFSMSSLRRITEDTGFRVERLSTVNIQYDAFGAVQSALNLILGKKNLLNDFNTGEVNLSSLWRSRSRWSDLSGLVCSELALAVGFPLFAVADFVLQPWVEGGTLRLVAINKSPA